MTENNILEESKQAYIELLRSTKREGIENLISYLETKTDFLRHLHPPGFIIILMAVFFSTLLTCIIILKSSLRSDPMYR